MLHWLIDWLAVWLIDWLFDWLTDWQTDWLTDWLIDWLIDWLLDRLTDWLTDWLTTDWLTDWLTVWLTDWLIWLIAWLARLFSTTTKESHWNSALEWNFRIAENSFVNLKLSMMILKFCRRENFTRDFPGKVWSWAWFFWRPLLEGNFEIFWKPSNFIEFRLPYDFETES